jgi:outer membrane lipoprotein
MNQHPSGNDRFWFPAILFFLISAGCTPIISDPLKREISRDITFKEVIKDPEAYKGKIVVFSGIILGSKNTKEGTLIEMLQKPADIEGRPKDIDESDGRFLAVYDGYLETAIYSRGREALVAGEVRGKRVLPLGEIEFMYPLISIKEIHLFKVRKEERFYPYPYPYWWYSQWWYYPYGCP